MGAAADDDADANDAGSQSRDWDGAWRRWQLESSSDGEGNVLQDAMAELVSAEAAVRAAKEEVDLAAEEKQALEEELAALQRARRDPFEQLDEIYELLAARLDRDTVLLSGGKALFAVALLSLAFRWRTDGPGSVAGCLLLPLACATGQI